MPVLGGALEQFANLQIDVIGRGWPEWARLVYRETRRGDNVLRHEVLSRQRESGIVGGYRTVSVLRKMLGNECCISHQGETRTAPAGGGRPASRTTCRKAMASPPPAESPPTTMWLGFTGRCAAPDGGSIRKRSGDTLAVGDRTRRRAAGRTGCQKVLQSAGEGVLRCKPILRSYGISSY